MKLLSISTDRKIFENESSVRLRQIECAKKVEELHIIVFSLRKLGFKSDKISSNVWIYPTNSLLKIFYVINAKKIALKIIGNRGNIKDWKITCQDPFETGLVGVWLKKKLQVFLELQIHTDVFSPYFTSLYLGIKLFLLNLIRQRIAIRILPKANHIRVVSERINKSLIEQFVGKKMDIEVRPVSITNLERVGNYEKDNNTYQLSNGIVNLKSNCFTATLVSRFEPEKNVKLAIKVWKKVVEKIPEAKLHIFGSGSEERKLKKFSRILSLNNSVIFEGWKNQEDIIKSLKLSKIFLNTSYYEGYGMALREAEKTGIKIITTDVGIARELKNTIVCNIGDEKCLVDSVLHEFNVQSK